MGRRKDVATRDDEVTALLDRLFARAEGGRYAADAAVEADLDHLFSMGAWGFREILLVVAIARLRDPDYRASTGFYDCNPRALYEGPIRAALRARRVPHMKSGPLNVAKASKGINQEWAAQRRPKGAGERVVRLVDRMERASAEELEDIAVAALARFLRAAAQAAALAVEAQPEADPARLYSFCERLIDEAPDAGNTPQRVVGLLLQSYHEQLQTGVQVSGHEDRASVTSTTGKKPGDILEAQADGTLLSVYEVSVKTFGEARVIDCHESIRAYCERTGADVPEVTVVCRREDRHPGAAAATVSALHLGTLAFHGLTFHFVNIYEWVMAQLLRMPPDARLAFYAGLGEYVADPSTAEGVKRCWKALHEAGRKE
jgi:hypothetical protein